jgi:Pentapeptide repeats (8 copies)
MKSNYIYNVLTVISNKTKKITVAIIIVTVIVIVVSISSTPSQITTNDNKSDCPSTNMKNFNDMSLSGKNFSECDLRFTSFNNTDLSRANLSHANLTGTFMGNSKLIDANFSWALMGGSNLAKSIATNSTMKGETCPEQI